MKVPKLGPIRLRQVGTALHEKLPESLRSEMVDGKSWLKVDLGEMADGRYGAGASELKDGSPTSLEG